MVDCSPIEYTDELRATLQRNIDAHEVRTVPVDERKRAAVAVVVVDSDAVSDDHDPYETTPIDLEILATMPGGLGKLDGRMRLVAGGAAFLLCRRASRMNRHAAQWALPGGRVDPGETPE